MVYFHNGARLYFCYYRQKLRRLEVALIEYRESLEERGIKSTDEIERKVAVHRRRLESEYGLSGSNEDASGNSKCLTEIIKFCSTSQLQYLFHMLFSFQFYILFALLLFGWVGNWNIPFVH